MQQGILVERAQDIFSFSHLTLQEYLTAKYIDDHNQVEQLVTNHLTDKRWKEVFLLVAGLMNRGADELLLLMMAEAEKYLATSLGKQYLVPILHWAEDVTKGSQGNLSAVAKRAIAYANANAYANTYANAYANTYADVNVKALVYAYDTALAYAYTYVDADANTYANANIYATTLAYANANATALAYANANAYAIALAYANANATAYTYALNYFIESAQELAQLPEVYTNLDFLLLINQIETLRDNLPSESEPASVHKKFAQKIINIWLSAFKLTPELINISQEVLEEIDKHYFYILWLMVECKQAAVRVSPGTWSAIEERMLRVPNK